MELLPSRKVNVDDFWSIQDYKSANHEPTSQHEHESVGDYTVSIIENLCAGRTMMREIKKENSLFEIIWDLEVLSLRYTKLRRYLFCIYVCFPRQLCGGNSHPHNSNKYIRYKK